MRKRLAGLACLIALTLAIRGETFGTAAPVFHWSKSLANPVLAAGAPWEESSLGSASVVYDGGMYKMWYAAQGAIGYATSSDGINWQRHPGNPVMTSAGEPVLTPTCISQVYDPEVAFAGGEWKMWYTTGCAWGIGKYVYAISLASSPDGITWTKHPGNPILRGSASWESASVQSPAVVVQDGVYRMWYTGTAPISYVGIGYATSGDGIQWTKFPGNPVIESPYEYLEPDVIWHLGQYHLWYAKGSPRHLYYAWSLNGVNWTDDPLNPALEAGAAGSWDEALEDPSVIYAAGQMQMWYSGRDSTGTRLGYAAAQTSLPALSANYPNGGPGSFFTLTASGFPPASTASVLVNGTTLTDTLSLDQDGGAVLLLDASQAEPGMYFVSLSAAGRAERIPLRVADGAPQRAKEGDGVVLVLPAGIGRGRLVFMPQVRR